QGANIVAYNAKMRDQTVSLAHLEADLHGALERREFKLLYQPIVDLRDGRIVGCEALLRWDHPLEGLLTPDRFFATAEDAQLLVPITRWIIRRACRVAGSLSQRLPPGATFYIGVNLSAQVLCDPELANVVERTLAKADISPTLLRFEITEGSLISNVGPARELLDRFHGMGIKLMLDDFGTGYSSLNYLQLFPFDCLKIDRSFVRRLSPDGSGSELLRAIVQMASSLGLQAVAEGIETQETADVLKQIGCQFGQGYLFSKPVDENVVAQLLQVQDRDQAAALPARTA
ncbi:MAG TPA: EAL domain-containing protein, partial [Steroidobacteraceae bacterium]